MDTSILPETRSERVPQMYLIATCTNTKAIIIIIRGSAALIPEDRATSKNPLVDSAKSTRLNE